MSRSCRESDPPRTKVGRLVAEYGLDGLPVELEAAWTATGPDHRSLRELATLFNERLVQAAMVDAGMNPLDGEAANLYDLLAGGDATGGTQVRAERRLDREGVDVEALSADFVSHQAIHTYLTKVREVEHDDGADAKDRGDTVERLLGRTRSVAESVVDDLDEVSIGEFDVSASVHVTCRECNGRYEFAELRRRGGCRCGE